MPLYTENLSDSLSVMHVVAPASVEAGAVTVPSASTGFNMTPGAAAGFSRLLFLINVGALGSSATVDFKLRSATTTNGTYADVVGGAITQIDSGDTNFAVVEIRRESLTSTTGYFVRGVLTVGTAATLVDLIVLGTTGYHPSGHALVTPVESVLV